MAISRYNELAQAFDTIAPGYDQVYGLENSLLMAWFRQENLDLLQATFAQEANLLEIGCGTGEEAIYLAQQGYRITATDVSPEMVAITRQKARLAGLDDRLTAITLPAGRLHELEHQAQFDGAYASFGCLNCEPDLPGLASALADLVKPGGAFVCSVMARVSPFEILWFLVHRQPGTATRRLKSGWQLANVNSGTGEQATISVPTRYLSRKELVSAFTPHLSFERSRAMGLLVPPPYLEAIYRRRLSFWRRMAILERRLRYAWPWRGIGDHVNLVFRVR